VERNPLRAGLVKRAEKWRWSSLAHRQADGGDPIVSLLRDWPLPMPADWLERVNRAETAAELEAVASRSHAGSRLAPRRGKSAWRNH
jgi:putative transposase